MPTVSPLPIREVILDILPEIALKSVRGVTDYIDPDHGFA